MESRKLKQLTNKTLTKLGSRVRTARKEKGWTQETLAEEASINDKEISHIELGRRNITIETLLKLSSALEISIIKLLE